MPNVLDKTNTEDEQRKILSQANKILTPGFNTS